ncbi:MAG: hypothetical protein ACI3ZO_08400, partial [Candidatus Cryptobacteroides sp.]
RRYITNRYKRYIYPAIIRVSKLRNEQSRVSLHAPDCEDSVAVRSGEENCAGLLARLSCCGVMGEAHSGDCLDNDPDQACSSPLKGAGG